MDRRDACERAAAALSHHAHALPSISGLVGFDGFVDHILDAVRTRRSMAQDDYERIATIAEFSDRTRAAAGLSTNIELVRTDARFGGNGPLLASGLMGLGLRAAFLGCIGDDNQGIHPLFHGFAARCSRVATLGPPGHTDALEFDDGKIMFNQTAPVQRADWTALVSAVGLDGLRALVQHATVIGMVNFSLCGGVEAIWRGLIDHVLPDLPALVDGRTRRVFIDLSDPAKRRDEDIARGLSLLTEMNRHTPVTLGLNAAEATRVAAVLNVHDPEARGREGSHIAALAARILDLARLDTVVIHPREGAGAAARADPPCWIAGPVTPIPRLSTGAGDHFNAGFAVAQALALPLPLCLAVATATSGCYVRDAASPTPTRVTQMLDMMRRGEA